MRGFERARVPTGAGRALGNAPRRKKESNLWKSYWPNKESSYFLPR